MYRYATRDLACASRASKADPRASKADPRASSAEPALPPARLQMLKDIFESMDVDGDGSVDVAEYRTSTDNKTMLKLYQLMDKRGDGNGSLSLDEWLTTMSLVGRTMTDAAFERDLASMLRPSNEVIASIAPERLAKLKSLFIQVGIQQQHHHQPVPVPHAAYIRAALVLAGSNSVHAAESVHAAVLAHRWTWTEMGLWTSPNTRPRRAIPPCSSSSTTWITRCVKWAVAGRWRPRICLSAIGARPRFDPRLTRAVPPWRPTIDGWPTPLCDACVLGSALAYI